MQCWTFCCWCAFKIRIWSWAESELAIISTIPLCVCLSFMYIFLEFKCEKLLEYKCASLSDTYSERTTSNHQLFNRSYLLVSYLVLAIEKIYVTSILHWTVLDSLLCGLEQLGFRPFRNFKLVAASVSLFWYFQSSGSSFISRISFSLFFEVGIISNGHLYLSWSIVSLYFYLLLILMISLTGLQDTMMMGADYYDTEAERASALAEDSVPLGVGENTKIRFYYQYLGLNLTWWSVIWHLLMGFIFLSRNCIIDKNARIGKNVVIANTDVTSLSLTVSCVIK